MRKCFVLVFSVLVLAVCRSSAQDANGPSAKPLENLIGTVTAVDTAAHAITIKQDKTGTERTVELANTKTLIKVAPGAKDLKSAVRITADELAVGDRVDVRGSTPEGNPTEFAARALILMSARDLQSARQAQMAAWQHSTAGVVTAVEGSTGKLTLTTRTPEGPKPVTIDTSQATQFTRYSPATPGVPASSSLGEIQIGDQVRVIGDKSADGSTITAQRLYSGAFRTISGTVLSIAPDGKELTVRNLANKQPVEVRLNDASAVRKLPPTVAMMLARRLNPAAAGAGGPGGSPREGGGPPPGANTQAPPATGSGAANGGQPPGGGMRMRARGGDISQMIEQLPTEPISDLKAGDAVVVAGLATSPDNSRLLATNVIAGVEPILQSAPTRQSRDSLGGDWGLGEMATPE
jgi:hypothetical protein